MGFNGLTDGEAERLALLMEEMGEAQQAIGKILRHGYRSFDPTKRNGPSNRDALVRELGDVQAAMLLLFARRDVSADAVHERAHEKIGKVRKYMHHQDDKETCRPSEKAK